MFAARTLQNSWSVEKERDKDVLSMFLKVDNVGAERMSSGRLFHCSRRPDQPHNDQ